jgi:hypothetical protein
LTTPIAPSTKSAFASSIGATSALTGQTNKTFLTQEVDTPGLATSSHPSGMKQQHYGNKGMVHYRPENTKQLIDLQAAATELYNLQHQRLAQDCHSVDIPLNEHLNHSPRQLHNYIRAQDHAQHRPIPPPSHIQHTPDHLLLQAQNMKLDLAPLSPT